MFLSRLLAPVLHRALRHNPVVVLTGARQTGKSTLLAELFPPERTLDLDDLEVLRAFRDRPERALDDALAGMEPGVVVLDEVQRVPDLTIAVKRVVDQGAPYRFVLTGSANLTLLGGVSETLAGRAEPLELLPMAWSEWRGIEPGRLAAVLDEGEAALEPAPVVPLAQRGEIEGLRARLLRHGCMPPLIERADPEARQAWLRGYHRTYLDRDVRDVGASVEPLLFSRAFELAALRTAGIVSWSDLARDLGHSAHTARRYLEVMRLGYQVWLLRPWAGSLTTRLVKAPRLYMVDPGVRNQVAGTEEPRGAVYETWVVGEVRKLLAAMPDPPRLSWFRTHGGLEVDLLLERADGIVAIEIKAHEELRRSDATALRRLRRHLGARLRLGLGVHPGARVERIEAGLFGVPDAILFG